MSAPALAATAEELEASRQKKRRRKKHREQEVATAASSEAPRPPTTPESKRESTVPVAPETLTSAAMAAAAAGESSRPPANPESKSESPVPVAPETLTSAGMAAAAVRLVKERERKNQVGPPASPLMEEPVRKEEKRRKKRKNGEAAVVIPWPPTPAAAQNLQMESKVTAEGAAVRKKQRRRKVEHEQSGQPPFPIDVHPQAGEEAAAGGGVMGSQYVKRSSSKKSRVLKKKQPLPQGFFPPMANPNPIDQDPNYSSFHLPPPPAMVPSSPRRKEPSSAAKRASTGPTALPGCNKRKTPPPLPEASGATQPPAKRKPAPFQRTWSPGDEVRILEALATYRREHGGSLPTPAELFGALDGSLEKKGAGPKELAIKQRSFKRRYDRDAKKTAPPADEHERRLYLLSRHVWGRDPPPRPPVAQVPRATQGKGAGAQASKDAAQAKSADHQSGKEAVKPKAKTLDEMRELYPYLVDEATILVEPAVLESVLLGIENSDAQALDKKIRKARKQLAKAITESARINNMEMPTVFMFTSSKLQPEKLRVENENNLLVDHLDKTDDVDSCTKQRLARVECEVLELRQAVIASQSQPKGIRCESAKSGLQSIVAENQTPANILQKKIEAPNGLIHGKNVEVTSKYYCAVPQNVPPSKPKMQGVMLPPFNAFPGIPRKVVKKSPTPRRATCRGAIC